MCDDAAAAAVTALERDASGSGDDDHEAAAWRAVLTAARRVDTHGDKELQGGAKGKGR